MYVLIIVIHYYMICLITVSVDYKQITKTSTALCMFFRLPKFHHINLAYGWTFIGYLSVNEVLILHVT